MDIKELAQLIENILDHNKLDDGLEVMATHCYCNGVPLDEVSISVVNEEAEEVYNFTLTITKDK